MSSQLDSMPNISGRNAAPVVQVLLLNNLHDRNKIALLCLNMIKIVKLFMFLLVNCQLHQLIEFREFREFR